MLRWLPRLLLTICVVALAGCGDSDEGIGTEPSPVDPSGGERITIDDSEALVWGDGDYGVVLAHGAAFDAASWATQGPRIAAVGATVVAVEDISTNGLAAAIDYLRDERGSTDVALVGGSAGADAILTLVSAQPDVSDQLVLLSPNRTVDGLGPQPKLFIASEGESGADVSLELAATAPGDENEALLLEGSAHAQNIFATDQGEAATRTIVDRLAQFVDR